MAKLISAAETAELVREELKRAFPGVRFSVRQERSAMGTSLHVQWEHGPEPSRVRAVTKEFENAGLNPADDSVTLQTGNLNGEKVIFGARWITCQRRQSQVTQFWKRA